MQQNVIRNDRMCGVIEFCMGKFSFLKSHNF